MIRVTKPVMCPTCGNMMSTFSHNKNTNTLVFSCVNQRHSLSLTEEEYKEMLRTGKLERQH